LTNGKLPGLRYRRKANTCNYCQKTKGFLHSAFGERERRILLVPCLCGKKHVICHGCARDVGSVFSAGLRLVKHCAKRYFWKNIRPKLAANGGKGA
jgi:hypothetical protein